MTISPGATGPSSMLPAFNTADNDGDGGPAKLSVTDTAICGNPTGVIVKVPEYSAGARPVGSIDTISEAGALPESGVTFSQLVEPLTSADTLKSMEPLKGVNVTVWLGGAGSPATPLKLSVRGLTARLCGCPTIND